MGEYLVVGLSTESFNHLKGKECYFTYEEREQLIAAVRYVDLVVPETCWEQKIEDVKRYHIDVFVIGDDWKGEFDFLRDYCRVVYLPRTPEIFTTQIKNGFHLRGTRHGQQRESGQKPPAP